MKRSEPGKRPTRADVAKKAGVSVATVSFALRNDPRISGPTTRKVTKAAAQLGYRPSTLAQSLQSGKTHILGLVIPDISNPYFGQLANNLEKEAVSRGYTLLVNLSYGNRDLERQRINELFDRQVDAIFISSAQSDTDLEKLSQTGEKVILLDRGKPVGNLKTVTSDLRKAAYNATTHLIEHGRRHIAILSGSDNPQDPRIVGWRQAQQQAKLKEGILAVVGFTVDKSYQATSRMLTQLAKKSIPLDALFASSDLVGLSALRALRKHNLRVPQDVAVVSLDGTFISRYTSPTLTVIQQNTAEIAKSAVSAALDPDAPQTRIVPTRLVRRQSCGCQPL